MSKRGSPRPPGKPPAGKAKAAAEPERQNRSRPVSELLPVVGRAAFRRFGFVQSAVVSRWPEIVGERYAAASRPESIRFPPGTRQDGVLTLAVRGAFAPMMQHVAPEIMERVNRFFGYPAVARLAIRQGEVAAPARNPAPRTSPSSVQTMPAEMGHSLRAIADPELKAVLESLAAGVAASGGLPRIG